MEQAFWMSKKSEYVSETIASTRDRFVQGLQAIYEQAENQAEHSKYVLQKFQMFLRDIPRWSRERKLEAAERFKFIPHLTQLLQNVHNLNEKIYGCTATQQEGGDPTDLVTFVHACYVNIARELFTKAQIMHTGVNAQLRRENYTLLEKIVASGIKHTLRRQVDFEHCSEDGGGGDVGAHTIPPVPTPEPEAVLVPADGTEDKQEQDHEMHVVDELPLYDLDTKSENPPCELNDDPAIVQCIDALDAIPDEELEGDRQQAAAAAAAAAAAGDAASDSSGSALEVEDPDEAEFERVVTVSAPRHSRATKVRVLQSAGASSGYESSELKRFLQLRKNRHG